MNGGVYLFRMSSVCILAPPPPPLFSFSPIRVALEAMGEFDLGLFTFDSAFLPLLLLLRRGGKRVSPEAVFRAEFQTEICLNLKSFDFWTDSSGVCLGCVIFESVFAPFQTHRANIDSARNRRLGPPLEMTQFIPLL